GAWDEAWTAPGLTPVGYLDRLGVLSARTLAVHAVRLDAADRGRLQTRGVTVVACPRSNERLGVGTAPVAQLLEEGVPVALGTDSLASAPDLDPFAELAALRRIHRIPPIAALRVATLNGARALGLGAELGSIEPGKLARLAVVPVEAGQDPLETLCAVPPRVHPLERAPR
ncbi:MAG TPA: amidohydrolase family protein, partial [Candidatus Polarisedimenticolaceae bacterium]|nr:amidohydrolase family protein [Candidatus Polarisedimenticolaceae bacterium]